jgi:hypothetical protein
VVKVMQVTAVLFFFVGGVGSFILFMLGKSITVVEDFWGNEFYNFVAGRKSFVVDFAVNIQWRDFSI